MKLDLNLLHNNSNPKIKKCEEHMKDSNPRKKDSNPIYRIKLKVEDQVKRFESLIYRFKSPFRAQFNLYKEDLNP